MLYWLLTLQMVAHIWFADTTHGSEYHDSTLNGVEIFKPNSSDGNLAGSKPQLKTSTQKGCRIPKEQKIKADGPTLQLLVL